MSAYIVALFLYFQSVIVFILSLGAVVAACILAASIILAIHKKLSSAKQPAKPTAANVLEVPKNTGSAEPAEESAADFEAPAASEDENSSGQCQGCHLAYECRGGDPKTCQTSK